MTNEARIDRLVLEEFELRRADLDGSVARIVATSHHGREPAIPLLTDIEERRSVATVRAFHEGEPTGPDAAEHAALDPFVSVWQPPRHYRPRITERSQSPPSHYRLAVTESGINDGSELLSRTTADATAAGAPSAVGLLWIGQPVGTHAGLLILLGNRDDQGRPDAVEWPLPLSRRLGVRIYDSGT
jgi:hypothetical protein